MGARAPAYLLLAGVVAASQSAAAATLAEQLSATRAEVDTLAEQLANARRQTRDELTALRSERAELQRRIRLEQVRADTLARLHAERSQRGDQQEEQLLAKLEPIRLSLAAAKQYVRTTLPFKRAERMAVLERIEANLSLAQPDIAQALTRLWRVVEDEEALARELELSQQPVDFGGQRVLAEVARIGMALMYFRLPSGEVGWVRGHEGTWEFVRLSDARAIQTVRGVFDALEANRALGPQRVLIPADLPLGAAEGFE